MGYEKPELIDLGTLADLTEGFSTGSDGGTTGIPSI